MVLFNNDTLLLVSSYLDDRGMTTLAKTCTHFGRRSNDNDHNSNDDNNNCSLMEYIARQIMNDVTDEEKPVLIRYDGESWIAVYRQLLIMRSRLVFGQLFGPISHIDGNKSSVRKKSACARECTAIGSQVMRGGKHFVKIRVDPGRSGAGVIRPIKKWDGDGTFNPFCSSQHAALRDNDNGRWGDSDVDICMYNIRYEECYACSWEENSRFTGGDSTWDDTIVPEGSVLGMLLDLDEGTLAIYDDNRRLGVVKSGLTGEYCWGVCMYDAKTASIARGKVPTG